MQTSGVFALGYQITRRAAAGTLILVCGLAQTSNALAQGSHLDAPALVSGAAIDEAEAVGSIGSFNRKRFTLSNPASDDTLNIGGMLQTRYLGSLRDREAETDDSYTGGFQVSRARLRVGGSIWSKALTFVVQTELSGRDGQATLLDAELKYTFENNVFVRFGQSKPGYSREEFVADSQQLTAERSVTNSIFTLGRSQLLGVGWNGSRARISAEVHEGAAMLNTPFDSEREADFALSTRGEWLAVGDAFKAFDEMTAFRGSDFAMLLGAAAGYETYGETGPGTAADRDIWRATVDLSLRGNGWNAMAAGFWRHTEPDTGSSADDFAFQVQGGVMASNQCELFARYEAILPDTINGPDDFHIITAGANYFLSPESHAARLTAQIMYYLDPTSESLIVTAPSTGNALLRDTEGDQVSFILQAQVVY
ncbi:MAG: hypothetical protein KF859_08945 [Phycisphaeraceae bacterium]|nr:hypothetical protein [Phycisphaeraceae bacterium]